MDQYPDTHIATNRKPALVRLLAKIVLAYARASRPNPEGSPGRDKPALPPSSRKGVEPECTYGKE